MSVRNLGPKKITGLTYDEEAPMTEKELLDLVGHVHHAFASDDAELAVSFFAEKATS